MNKLTVPYKGKFVRFDFASDWSEVPARALPWLGKNLWPMAVTYRHLLQCIAENKYLETIKVDTDLQTGRIAVLKQLCGIGWWPFSRRNRAFYSLEADEVADVLQHINFVFKRIDVKQPFDEFDFLGYTYYGPKEKLANLSGAEFHFAEIAFTKALQGDEHAVAELAAILYRPRGKGQKHDPNNFAFTGDVREPFNRFSLDKRAKHFLALSDKKKYPILLWFAGCRAAIIENYPEIFSKGTAEGNGNGWMDIFRALAKEPLHFEAIAEKHLSFLLWELTKIDQDARRAELAKLNKQ
jgi:hypothetical protein